MGRLHVMSAGMRVFVKHKRTGGPFPFRLASEACALLSERMTKRVVSISLDDAAKLIVRVLCMYEVSPSQPPPLYFSLGCRIGFA